MRFTGEFTQGVIKSCKDGSYHTRVQSSLRDKIQYGNLTWLSLESMTLTINSIITESKMWARSMPWKIGNIYLDRKKKKKVHLHLKYKY